MIIYIPHLELQVINLLIMFEILDLQLVFQMNDTIMFDLAIRINLSSAALAGLNSFRALIVNMKLHVFVKDAKTTALSAGNQSELASLNVNDGLGVLQLFPTLFVIAFEHQFVQL